MKSVMISIRPQWCDLIASGKKTVEVRKTRPKCDTPFKVYIYQSKPKKIPFYCDILRQAGKENTAELLEHSFGKVIGEFVCDKIYGFVQMTLGIAYTDKKDNFLPAQKARKMTCLTDNDICNYLGSKDGYGWHISDLVIYDKPRELSEFKLKRPFQSWGYIDENNN